MTGSYPNTRGLGGDRKGESQMGRRTQASGARQTRSPRQASAPACTGSGAIECRTLAELSSNAGRVLT